MIKLTTKNEFDEFVKNNDVCVVKFGAEWCGPCKMLNKTLEVLEKTDITYKIGECDVDDDEILEIAQSFGIQNIPFLCFFKNGEPKDVHQGIISSTDLNNKVNSIE